MMAYTLDEYYQMRHITDASHVVVYPNNAVASSVLNYHKANEVTVISLADCLPDNATVLPMPEAILPNLDGIITNKGGRVIVVGIDAYLSLLSESNVTSFFTALCGRIDNENPTAIYMVSSERFPDYQFLPRYTEARKILKISGDYEVCEAPKITVVSDKWVQSDTIRNYKALLKYFGSFLPIGTHTLVLKDISNAQAGLSNCVSFLLDIKQVAERFYGVCADLGTATLEMLIAKANEENLLPENYLEIKFGEANIDVKLALKRLNELPDDELWPAYVRFISKRNPDTYLAKVLSEGVTHGNLLRKYIVDIAITVINNSDAGKFAFERANALTGLQVESLVIEFIEQTKEIDSAIEFLNCGTIAERIEIIRRASKLNLAVGLPESLKRLYPSLQDYLSVEYDYGNPILTTYFKEYRLLKLNNTINSAFAKKAFEIELPSSFPSRETLLSSLRADGDVALLVVDGMGAEYFPLLLAMAKRRNMNVESSAVASVNLPTSTEYNPIGWELQRTLKSVKGVDNIVHDGAEKHEHNSPEQNIEMSLRKFDEVFNRLAKGLGQFSRIVVTADHGSSRLAVLAHNKGLIKNLPWDGQPDDWRYAVAPENCNRPDEFEAQYHPKSGKTYWVVRGYNRLPKPGGKLNELHGGASFEERLVPVVVFTRSKNVAPPKQVDKKVAAQIVDRMDFDI